MATVTRGILRQRDGDFGGPLTKRLKAGAQTILVVRHGEGQHQLKKAAYAAARIDTALGPALTEKGVQQAEDARAKVAVALSTLSGEQ
ncbi:unnamed protein product, partial [Polarella glacialis]